MTYERGIEHWSTGDETSIDEHVILFIKIVVNTTLYVSTQIVLGIEFSLVLAIVHTIVRRWLSTECCRDWTIT